MPCDVHEVLVSEVRPAIDGVMRRRFGSVEVDLVDDGHAIVGTVVPMPVDPVKLQLDRTPDAIVALDVLAPFSVRVDKATNLVLPDVVNLPADAWPLVAGLRVREGSKDFVVTAVDLTRVSLQDPACLTAPKATVSLPSTPNTRLVLALAALSCAGLAAVVLGRRATRT